MKKSCLLSLSFALILSSPVAFAEPTPQPVLDAINNATKLVRSLFGTPERLQAKLKEEEADYKETNCDDPQGQMIMNVCSAIQTSMLSSKFDIAMTDAVTKAIEVELKGQSMYLDNEFALAEAIKSLHKAHGLQKDLSDEICNLTTNLEYRGFQGSMAALDFNFCTQQELEKWGKKLKEIAKYYELVIK